MVEVNAGSYTTGSDFYGYGLIDASGKEISPLDKYIVGRKTLGQSVKSGMVAVGVAGTGKKTIIDLKGKELITPAKGYVDVNRNIVVAAGKYKKIEPYKTDKGVVVAEGNDHGKVNGRRVFTPKDFER